MKKALLYSLLFAGIIGMTTSCGNDDDNSSGTGNDNGDNSGIIDVPQNAITVNNAEDAQKEFDRVGRELLNKIDAEKFRSIITLAQFCEEEFFYDDYEEYDPGYYPPYNGLNGIMRHISATAKGDFTGVTSIKRIAKTYGFGDYCGIYTWNAREEEWFKTESTDELTYKFNHEGKPCVVTVKNSGSEYTFAVKENNLSVREYIKIPERLTATVTENGAVLASFNLNVAKCDQAGKGYQLDAEMNVSDYIIRGTVTDDNTTAQAKCNLTLNGEKLIEGEMEVNGNALADDSAFLDDFDNKNVKNGKATYSLLRSINLNVEADNRSGLIDKLDFDGYYSYYEYKYDYMDAPYIYSHSDKATAEREAREAADAANRYTTSSISFAKGDYRPRMEWEAYICYQYDYSWGGTSGNYSRSESQEWDIRPVIIFDNDGRYSFENYFTETRFSSLITVFESLMNDFDYVDM